MFWVVSPRSDLFLEDLVVHMSSKPNSSEGESEPTTCGSEASTAEIEKMRVHQLATSWLTPVVTAAMVYSGGDC